MILQRWFLISAGSVHLTIRLARGRVVRNVVKCGFLDVNMLILLPR